MDSLAGSFLVATNQMPDPRFGEKIIYMCSHNENDGAMVLFFYLLCVADELEGIAQSLLCMNE